MIGWRWQLKVSRKTKHVVIGSSGEVFLIMNKTMSRCLLPTEYDHFSFTFGVIFNYLNWMIHVSALRQDSFEYLLMRSFYTRLICYNVMFGGFVRTSSFLRKLWTKQSSYSFHKQRSASAIHLRLASPNLELKCLRNIIGREWNALACVNCVRIC